MVHDFCQTAEGRGEGADGTVARGMGRERSRRRRFLGITLGAAVLSLQYGADIFDGYRIAPTAAIPHIAIMRAVHE